MLILILIAGFNLLPYVHAVDSTVSILPAPPTNATAVNTTSTEVLLTWDASITPAASLASYTVFYKESTDPSYPGSPQITRIDDLASYSESITVTDGVLYDFIIYTNANSGGVSLESCASCTTVNSLLCGNGTIDAGEDCDGILLGGAVCTDFGYVSGTLACSATCDFDYSACSSGGGGGGGGDDSDTIDPIHGTASSPAYANLTTVTVDFSGASDIGGSGFSNVKLLYKKNVDGWKDSGLSSTNTSGSFDFIMDDDQNAVYRFALQAFDNDGNSSSGGSGQGDTETILDRQAPVISTINIPALVSSTPMIITYEGATDVGLADLDHVELWHRLGTDGAWIDSGLTSATESGSFSFDGFGPSGTYYFDLIAVDKAGNRSIEDTEYLGAGSTYDVDPPFVSSVSVALSADTVPIQVSYTGAQDLGSAGFKHIELWYRINPDGTWTNSGLSSTQTDGTFDFEAVVSEGIYYFYFVLEDNFGNRSDDAIGDGMASVDFNLGAFVATLSNPPSTITASNSINTGVAGENIVAYKYSLDGAEYSDEQSISKSIAVSNLTEGAHSINVIGKHDFGLWQSESSPTSHSWTIDFAQPVLNISGPVPTDPITNYTSDKSVNYTVNYTNTDIISLALGDITLNKTGDADGTILLSVINESSRLVTISSITGNGTLGISIAAGTGAHSNGNETTDAGPSAAAVVAIETASEGEEEEETPDDSGEGEGEGEDEGEGEGEDEETTDGSGGNEEEEEEETTGGSEEGESGSTNEEEEEEEEEEIQEIVPPAPAVTYTPVEIQEKAIEVIEAVEVIEETPVTIQLERSEVHVKTRIEECIDAHPNINFESSSLDSDEDGLANKTECYAFTNPELPDTDTDGCLDGDEINVFGTDPLDGSDCKDPEKLRAVSISTPQAGWLLSSLEIAGTTSDETSIVNLVAFPVDGGETQVEKSIDLGEVSRFRASSIENNFYFELDSKAQLIDEQDYDLLAISTLRDGETIVSKPIRFSLDSDADVGTPQVISLGNTALDDSIKLDDVTIKPSEDGKVEVRGSTEYGVQVFAVWQSVVLASSVIADSELGQFSIQSPKPLELDEGHRVTLYAVKKEGDTKLRSKNVVIKFRIVKSGVLPYIIGLLLLLSTTLIVVYKTSRKKN